MCNFIKTFMVFFVLSSPFLFAMEKVETSSPAIRSLVIIINEEPHKPMDPDGTIRSLLVNLTDKTGPLLFSATLLNRFVNDFNGKNIIIQPLIGNSARFEASDWVIKKANNSLFLLIPRDYLEGLSIDPNTVSNLVDEESITEDEKKLGLRISHFETFSFANIGEHLAKNITQFVPKTDLIDLFYDVKKDRSELFCRETSLKQKFSWHIVILGHGGISTNAAGIPILAFKEFLHVLHNYLPINLLVTISCFLAGFNEKTIYDDGEVKKYKFTIITPALTDAAVTIRFRGRWSKDNRTFIIDAREHDYKNFIKTISLEDKNFKNISWLFQFLPGGPQMPDWNNWAILPRIRYPYSEQFVPMAPESDIATMEDWNQSSSLQEMVKGRPAGVLFYRDNLNELKVDYRDLKAFVFMNPGCKTYSISQILAPGFDIDDVLDWFMRVENLHTRKIVYVDNINTKKSSISNVVIVNEPDENIYHAFYLDAAGNKFHYQRQRVEKGINTAHEKLLQNDAQNIYYENLLAETKNCPTNFECITCSEEWLNSKIEDKFKTLTHIKELKTPDDSNITLSDLFKGIYNNKITKGIIVHIDKVYIKASSSANRIILENFRLYSLPGLYRLEYERNGKKTIAESDSFPAHYFNTAK